MNDEEIIRMAREAGLAFDFDDYPDIWQVYLNVDRHEIKRFAELVAAHEREACAKICDSVDNYANPMTASDCADAIRARGES